MGDLIPFPEDRDEEQGPGARAGYLARTPESALVWRVECRDCSTYGRSVVLWRVQDEGQARRWGADHARMTGHEVSVSEV